MLHDLDKTLKQLLEAELVGLFDPNTTITISFDPPEATFAPGGPTVNLFLYDIQEDRKLRQNELLVERQGNAMAVKRRPPIRVECSYLVTAWSSDAENEHLLLGEVLKVLLRYQTIPRHLLQGSLADQALPLPTTVLQPGRLQSLGEFWQAMGGKPRAALHYTVTLGVSLDKAPLPALPVVTEYLFEADYRARTEKQQQREHRL
jgi:hypothetical protein